MVRRKFRTAESCRAPRKCLSLQANTYRDKLWPYQVWAYWERALSMAARFDRTTCCVPNFSSARLTIGSSETLPRQIAWLIRRSFGHGAPESDAFQQRMYTPRSAPVLLLGHH